VDAKQSVGLGSVSLQLDGVRMTFLQGAQNFVWKLHHW